MGDIIVVYSYKSGGIKLPPHSFVILDNNKGHAQGMDYDWICLVMSSFKGNKAKVMRYKGTFPIVPDDEDIKGGGNSTSGYIKANQFYYFKKDKIKYKHIGKLKPEIFELLVDYINELIEKKTPFEQHIDNL